MVSVLFNICDGKIIYTEIIGLLRDFSKIQICSEYILESNKKQEKVRWSVAFDAYIHIFVINIMSYDKPVGLYESIERDGYFSIDDFIISDDFILSDKAKRS
jgi:hypothetical protein